VSGATTSEIESAWTQIRSSLRSELGEASYQSWIAVLANPAIKDGTLSINAPNRFIRDKVADRFGACVSIPS